MVYASDISESNAPISIDYSDIVPFSDQLSMVKGNEIDIILEAPGGIGEVVEDLVKIVRNKFEKVGIIIPGMAKSAGTIFTMAADEILMGELSALGPIDAQMFTNGKHYSADAFLEGLKKIKDESNINQRLDLAYIPMLQHISPGEIQHCENAQNFSKELVTTWLVDYKFKFWEKHKSTGKTVTLDEKKERASEIAKLLCNHSYWLTHSRSIRIPELQKMGLQIIDYSNQNDLNDAITRYYSLLRMSFETNIYKIYETPSSQIYRSTMPPMPFPQFPQIRGIPNPLIADFICEKCNNAMKLQINFETDMPLENGVVPFPKNNKLKCPICHSESDLLNLRQQLEGQFKKKIV